MPDVFLIRESDSKLYFAHSILSGWIFAAIGGALVFFGMRFAPSNSAEWMAIGTGVVFGAFGVGGALWRYDLTVDLAARSFRGRRGFWPSPRSLQGSLSELEGVLLTRSWRHGKNSEHALWVVSLGFGASRKPISFFETTSERKGYRKLEELARRVQIPAIDRTGEQETVRPPDELDRSIADDERIRGSASVHEIADPPPGSGIEWTRSGFGAPMIVLPACGLGAGSVFIALFGLPFLGFGLVALASAMGWTGVGVHGTLVAKWVVGGVFVAIGSLMLAGAIFGGVAREVVREDADALLITLRAFGRHYRKRRLLRREIEEVSIKPTRAAQSRASRSRSVAEKTEVVVRSDEIVARIAGDLTADSQQWLVDALLSLARR